jgi:hypothetical protein
MERYQGHRRSQEELPAYGSGLIGRLRYGRDARVVAQRDRAAEARQQALDLQYAAAILGTRDAITRVGEKSDRLQVRELDNPDDLNPQDLQHIEAAREIFDNLPPRLQWSIYRELPGVHAPADEDGGF